MLHLSENRPKRRRTLRRAVDIPCEIVSKFVDEPLLYWATDLSPYGIWIETPIPMRTGEVVCVCFQPAAGWAHRELRVFAEVARVTTARRRTTGVVNGMGLEFCDLSPHEERALGAWLRGRPPPLPRRKSRACVTGRELPAPRYALPN